MASVDEAQWPSDLYVLRKGAGMTLSKLQRNPSLCVLAGVGPHDAVAAHERIRGVLAEMTPSRSTEALSNALAVGDPDPGLLEERRKRFAEVSGVSSTNTIENWERAGFNELFARLKGFRNRTPLLIQQAESDVFVERRLIHHCVERRTVVAQAQGVTDYSYASGPTSIIHGSETERWEELFRDEESSAFTVWFSHPLNVGETYRYSFRVTDPDEADREPDTRGYFGEWFEVGVVRYRIRVRFIDELPARVWWYKHRPPLLVRAQEPLVNELLEPAVQVAHEFALLSPNTFDTGIAWEW
jgi:hypothetical protein